MARIVIVTDAWHPQVNGVVRTLTTTIQVLRSWGHQILVVEPSAYLQIPIPFYPEICLSLPRPGSLYRQLRNFNPDHIHLSTEGPLGLLARQFCLQQGWRFTTSYHTRFPEYLNKLMHVPCDWTYRLVRHFHRLSSCMMVATPSLEQELQGRHFVPPIRRWSRGVDFSLFRPIQAESWNYPRPILLYVGRVSHEKGIEEFLKVPTTVGSKVIVGDGPARAELEHKYPEAKFLGFRRGQDLVACYARADLFVFPSRTDTFGLVLIEALACGLPVAAFPVTGPADIISSPQLGALNDDLHLAIQQALASGDRQACLEAAAAYTWERCTQQFLSNLVPKK